HVGQPLLIALTKGDRFSSRIPRGELTSAIRGDVIDVKRLETNSAHLLCALIDNGAEKFYDAVNANFDRISCHLVSATGGDVEVEGGTGRYVTAPDIASLTELLVTLVSRLGILPDSSTHRTLS